MKDWILATSWSGSMWRAFFVGLIAWAIFGDGYWPRFPVGLSASLLFEIWCHDRTRRTRRLRDLPKARVVRGARGPK